MRPLKTPGKDKTITLGVDETGRGPDHQTEIVVKERLL